MKTKWDGNDLFYAELLNEKKKISCLTLVGVNKKGICLLVLPFFSSMHSLRKRLNKFTLETRPSLAQEVFQTINVRMFLLKKKSNY